MQHEENLSLSLLPAAQLVRPRDGCAQVVRPQLVGVYDHRLMSALEAWQGEIIAAPHAGRAVELEIAVQEMVSPEAYRLDIDVERIKLTGGSIAGCFYGIQTIRQLTNQKRGSIPCCHIEDRPALAQRGLLLDISRGKVPTLDTLKLLVDRISLWKMNVLQIYIEHAFVFSFDPDICSEDDGLTPDETTALCRYAADRFVEVVPAVANLGHMGRMLAMPRYRHLAEIEAESPWEEMTWSERQRGFTLNTMHPDSYRLIESILGEIMTAFPGSTLNLCGDEPWDLGRGKSLQASGFPGRGKAYLDHIRRVCRFSRQSGRKSQLWSDVLVNHEELHRELPEDLVILHWGYDDDTDYEGLATFQRAGVPTIACPGTSGWKRTINAFTLAQRNIATFADAARRHGALGLLNTDWGDDGHVNPLGCSWLGIAFGAEHAWHESPPSEFDLRLARCLSCESQQSPIALLRRISDLVEDMESWRCFWQQPVEATSTHDWQECERACLRMEDWCRSHAARSFHAHDVADWLASAALTRMVVGSIQPRSAQQKSVAKDADERQSASDAFEHAWSLRNKVSGLDDVLSAIRAGTSDSGWRA